MNTTRELEVKDGDRLYHPIGCTLSITRILCRGMVVVMKAGTTYPNEDGVHYWCNLLEERTGNDYLDKSDSGYIYMYIGWTC